VRSGTRRGHTYHLLAAQRGPRKIFEPFLVTLNDRSEVFPGFQHPGTEFIHMLSGVMHYRHGRHSYLLNPGDTLTFRGDVAHGPSASTKCPSACCPSSSTPRTHRTDGNPVRVAAGSSCRIMLERHHWRDFVAVTASVAVLGVGVGSTLPLTALVLTARGLGPEVVGWMTAAVAAGASPARWPHRRPHCATAGAS